MFPCDLFSLITSFYIHVHVRVHASGHPLDSGVGILKGVAECYIFIDSYREVFGGNNVFSIQCT